VPPPRRHLPPPWRNRSETNEIEQIVITSDQVLLIPLSPRFNDAAEHPPAIPASSPSVSVPPPRRHVPPPWRNRSETNEIEQIVITSDQVLLIPLSPRFNDAAEHPHAIPVSGRTYRDPPLSRALCAVATVRRCNWPSW
jgi:hypothetical protein